MNKQDRAKYLDDFIRDLSTDGVILKPCLEGDIERVNSITRDKTLPQAYLEFLQAMGRGASFLRGHSCFMDEIFDLRQGSEELLYENDFGDSLTDNDFVFWMSQGYMFCFFKLNDGNNPAVYFYSETTVKRGFIKISDSFTDFLERFYHNDKTLFRI